MRHRRARTKLGRTSGHRRAMFSNMLQSLVEHGRIETTHRKAKELRGMADRAVTRATSLGELLLKDWTKLSVEDRAKVVHAVRMARRTIPKRDMVLRLFDEIAPRYLNRPGGYTRMLKTGFRKGDGAPMAIVEFVASEMPPREGREAVPAEKEKKKGLLDRIVGKGA